MGIYNSKPIMEISKVEGTATSYDYCSCSVQGWRKGQEDCYRTIPDYTPKCSLFCIFDGHGGPEVSHLSSRNFPDMLLANPNFQLGKYSKSLQETYLEFDRFLNSDEAKEELLEFRIPLKESSFTLASDEDEDIDALLKEADMPLDQIIKDYKLRDTVRADKSSGVDWEQFLKEGESEDDEEVSMEDLEEESSATSEEESEEEEGLDDSVVVENDEDTHPAFDCGTTAVVALLFRDRLVVANAGDSRCVVCRGGKCLPMTEDHKPEDESESARISKAGSVISFGRVDNGLNLSRALGDWRYKQKSDLTLEEQAITSLPDVRDISLTEDDEFMVAATDGIWNSLSSEQTIDYVRYRLRNMSDSESLSDICSDLFGTVLAENTNGDGTGCDNMTCSLVLFKDLSYFKSLPTLVAPVFTCESNGNGSPSADINKDDELNSTDEEEKTESSPKRQMVDM